MPHQRSGSIRVTSTRAAGQFFPQLSRDGYFFDRMRRFHGCSRQPRFLPRRRDWPGDRERHRLRRVDRYAPVIRRANRKQISLSRRYPIIPRPARPMTTSIEQLSAAASTWAIYRSGACSRLTAVPGVDDGSRRRLRPTAILNVGIAGYAGGTEAAVGAL